MKRAVSERIVIGSDIARASIVRITRLRLDAFAHPIPQAHSWENLAGIAVIHGPSPVLHSSGNTGVVHIRTM
jgi:hypothetical protein